MTLNLMEVGVGLYADGSGFRLIVSMNKDGQLSIKQGEHLILLRDRNECAAMIDAKDDITKLKD